VNFCPEYRRQVLVPPMDSRLKALVREKQHEYGYALIEMEVKPGHVPLLLEVEPRVVGQIKGYSARSMYPHQIGDTGGNAGSNDGGNSGGLSCR
jgi:REP element-mobilizing transposase RayT